MPRFGTRSLLIGFALMALWLSTFSGFTGSQDVRRSMLLLILVASLFLAIYSRGKRRAYWSGFAVVILLCGGLNLQQPFNRYVPDFAWQHVMGLNIQRVPTYAPTVYPVPMQPPVASYAPPSPHQPSIPYITLSSSRSAGWVAIGESLAAGWTLGLSALSGFIAAYIISRTRPVANEATLRARQIVEQELQSA